MNWKMIGSKFLLGMFQGAAASTGVQTVQDGNPLDPNALAMSAGTALAVGTVKAIMNAWKHRNTRTV